MNPRESTLYCGFTPDGTETFRFTSSGHPCGGGFNLQTVPKDLRYLYLAPPGRVYVQPDLRQAEARYVAYRAQCLSLIDVFNDPTRNIHLERARAIFGHPIEKDSLEYLVAKASLHAGNYRMGPGRFAQMINQPLREAKKLLTAAMAPYPEIPRWHQEVLGLLQSRGWLENCWGQKRHFHRAVGELVATGRVGTECWNDAMAWEPQSAIPQIINKAIHAIRAKEEKMIPHEENRVWFHQHGHDSFLASIPEHRLHNGFVQHNLLALLAIPMQIRGRELIIPVDLQVGWNWGQMVPYRDGLSRKEWAVKVGKPKPVEVVRALLQVVA